MMVNPDLLKVSLIMLKAIDLPNPWGPVITISICCLSIGDLLFPFLNFLIDGCQLLFQFPHCQSVQALPVDYLVGELSFSFGKLGKALFWFFVHGLIIYRFWIAFFPVIFKSLVMWIYGKVHDFTDGEVSHCLDVF